MFYSLIALCLFGFYIYNQFQKLEKQYAKKQEFHFSLNPLFIPRYFILLYENLGNDSLNRKKMVQVIKRIDSMTFDIISGDEDKILEANNILSGYNLQNINIEYVNWNSLKNVKVKFYENGFLKSRILLDEKGKENYSIQWWDNGRIKTEAEYNNGFLDGYKINYYESGQIKSSCQYNNGKEDGLLKNFDENGLLIKKYEFSNGKFDGTSFHYNYLTKNSKPTLKFEYPYKNGLKHGVHKFFGRFSVWYEIEYKNNIKDGKMQISQGFDVDDNRIIIGQCYYKNGLISGKAIIWNSDNVKLSESIYEKGKIISLVEWHENGLIKCSGSWIDNKRMDDWEYFRQDGEIDKDALSQVLTAKIAGIDELTGDEDHILKKQTEMFVLDSPSLK